MHYPPQFAATLMVNTLDAHGGLPEVGKPILFHQKIVIGSYKQRQEDVEKPYMPIASNFYPARQAFLPQYALAIDLLYQFKGPNKDLCFPVQALHQGIPPKAQLTLLAKDDSPVEVPTHSYANQLFLRSTLG